jgi:hypothetical protein
LLDPGCDLEVDVKIGIMRDNRSETVKQLNTTASL